MDKYMSNIKQSKKSNESNELDSIVLKETVDALYKALPLSVISNIVIASTLVFIIWPVIEHSTLLIWLSIMVLANIVRYISYKAYSRSDKSQSIYWDKLFYSLMIVTGLVWSTVCIWLLPDNNSIYHYLPVLILIGISAGAITTLGYKMRNLVTYYILVIGPVVISESIIQTSISNSIAGLSILMIVVALSNARRISQAIEENIRLRYKSQSFHQELIESKNTAVAANSAKTNFISMISHELRTPLNGILGFSQLLKMSDQPPLNDEQNEHVKGILDSGVHLVSLIEELLELSKIEAHKLNISIVDVSLTDSLSESISILKTIASEYNIKIIDKVENTYVVRADEKRLKQIFINFLSNAIKYNRANGNVVIEANNLLNGNVRVTISDEGNGLSKEQINSIFKAFTRYESTREGIGLGLYITKNLIELMNGSVGVESEINKGSTFWFELPLLKI